MRRASAVFTLLLAAAGAGADQSSTLASPALPSPPLWLASFPPFAVVPVFPPQVIWPLPIYFLPNYQTGGWPLPFPFPAYLMQPAPGAKEMTSADVRSAAPNESITPVGPERAASGLPKAGDAPAHVVAPLPMSPQSAPVLTDAVAPRVQNVPGSQATNIPQRAEAPANASQPDTVPIAIPLPKLDSNPPAAGVPRQPSQAQAVSALAHKPRAYNAKAPVKPAAHATKPAKSAVKPAKRRLCWNNGMVDACP